MILPNRSVEGGILKYTDYISFRGLRSSKRGVLGLALDVFSSETPVLKLREVKKQLLAVFTIWAGVVVPVMVRSIDQIELFENYLY